jgi:superfamily II DNA helicase RecQ
VVVSPLIALMHDQVGALHEVGVAAAFLNSTLDGDEARRIERELLAGRLTLLYAAPERILTPRRNERIARRLSCSTFVKDVGKELAQGCSVDAHGASLLLCVGVTKATRC